MIWTLQRLILFMLGLMACWWLDPTLLPLLAGVGAFEMGCGCGCGPPLSACEICCTNGIAETIKITIPDGLFTDGLGCTPCADLDDLEIFADNFTVLDDCDWLLVDTTSVCGGPTSRSFGVGIRESGGTCTIGFQYNITCSGFPSIYRWETTFSDGSDCETKTLPYHSAILGDGDCCTIDGAPGDVLVDLNP